MNWKLIEDIADAVLYEGYVLYPYRPSAVKNRQRWNFGVVYPKSDNEQGSGFDPCLMQTECLARGGGSTSIEVRLRFLQAISHQVGKLKDPTPSFAEGSKPRFDLVESLETEDQTLQTFQEAAPRDVTLGPFRLAELSEETVRKTFAFRHARELEAVRNAAGLAVAVIVRTQETILGCVEMACERCDDGLFRLMIRASNLFPTDAIPDESREAVLPHCLLSTHTIVTAEGGEFISMTDPPGEFREAASACKNIGTWPVLVGEEPAKDAMLSSPIILYDYPQIAPESAGNLFDGTEIDEILALRILTLSDDEKSEIRRTDKHAREILERIESLPAEHLMKLHGVLRGMNPAAQAHSGSADEAER